MSSHSCLPGLWEHRDELKNYMGMKKVLSPETEAFPAETDKNQAKVNSDEK